MFNCYFCFYWFWMEMPLLELGRGRAVFSHLTSILQLSMLGSGWDCANLDSTGLK